MEQRSLDLRTWGGARQGAGRRPSRPDSRLPHAPRIEVRPYQPVHVTLRMAEHVWNLRSERSFRVFHGALTDARRRRAFRVVHFSIQGNHVHLLVEADGTASLSNGVRALAGRLARRLNGMMGRTGPVFADRFQAHVLKTPAEVRNALRYVLGNFAGHAERWGEHLPAGWVDPFSSAGEKAPRRAQLAFWDEPVTRPARSWLLRHPRGR